MKVSCSCFDSTIQFDEPSAPWVPGFGLLIHHLQSSYPQAWLSSVSCIFMRVNPCVSSNTSVFEV